MRKIIAGIALTLFMAAVTTVVIARTDDKPKKAKTEQCCEKKDCQKTDCKKECTAKCNSEKPCK